MLDGSKGALVTPLDQTIAHQKHTRSSASNSLLRACSFEYLSISIHSTALGIKSLSDYAKLDQTVAACFNLWKKGWKKCHKIAGSPIALTSEPTILTAKALGEGPPNKGEEKVFSCRLPVLRRFLLVRASFLSSLKTKRLASMAACPEPADALRNFELSGKTSRQFRKFFREEKALLSMRFRRTNH